VVRLVDLFSALGGKKLREEPVSLLFVELL
jgi:hypothetical protein